MTEIDDLGAFLAQAQRLPGLREQQIAAMERAMLAERIELVSRFAAILCDCKPRYDRWDSTPPQLNCSIHGVLMRHPYTGAVIMAGLPDSLDVFTPAPAPEPPARNDEETHARDRDAHRDRPAAG